MQNVVGLAVRQLKFAEIELLGLRLSLSMGLRVGVAIEKSLSYGVSWRIRKAFNLVWLASTSRTLATMRLRPRFRLRAGAKDRSMDRKPLSLKCDPEQYSTLLWPPAMCNRSCIRQELACYSGDILAVSSTYKHTAGCSISCSFASSSRNGAAGAATTSSACLCSVSCFLRADRARCAEEEIKASIRLYFPDVSISRRR